MNLTDESLKGLWRELCLFSTKGTNTDHAADTKLLENINNSNILNFLREMLSEEEGNRVGTVYIVVLSSEYGNPKQIYFVITSAHTFVNVLLNLL